MPISSFNEENHTVKSIAASHFGKDKAADLPENLATQILQDENLFEVAMKIDEYRFGIVAKLGQAAGTTDITTLNRLVNEPETIPYIKEEVLQIANQVKFLCQLAQTILHL